MTDPVRQEVVAHAHTVVIKVGTSLIAPGGQIRETEPPVDIQEVIAKFIFGNVESKTPEEGPQ